jgi:hypothetical protein
LKQWGYEKNLPAKDMEALVLISRKRAAQGKETVFYHGGSEVKKQRLNNFKRRQGSKDTECTILDVGE